MDPAEDLPICIDSDDDGPRSNRRPEVLERLQCVLMLPMSALDQGLRSVGSVQITLEASGGSASSWSDLAFMRTDPFGDALDEFPISVLPRTFVTHLELSTGSHAIHLRLTEAVPATTFWALSEATDEFVDEIILLPRSNEVMSVLNTLRFWLPHVMVLGSSIPVWRHGDAVVLKLEGIELTSRDIQYLDDEQWLNDSVLDFFMRLIVDVMAPDALRGDLYVASSFFFQKLTSGGVADGEEGWHNVKRWTRSLAGGPLGRRYFVVPINEQNMHWWMAVICHPSQALDNTSYQTEGNHGNQPRIVCLDSAVDAPPKKKSVGFLRGYIWREWCEQQLSATSFPIDDVFAALQVGKNRTMSLLRCVEKAEVPRQANGWDCGVFIIEYLLQLLCSKQALRALGLARHNHWFDQNAVSHRRAQLRWIVTSLQAAALKHSESDVLRLLQLDERLRADVVMALTDRPESPPGSEHPEEADVNSVGLRSSKRPRGAEPLLPGLST